MIQKQHKRIQQLIVLNTAFIVVISAAIFGMVFPVNSLKEIQWQLDTLNTAYTDLTRIGHLLRKTIGDADYQEAKDDIKKIADDSKRVGEVLSEYPAHSDLIAVIGSIEEVLMLLAEDIDKIRQSSSDGSSESETVEIAIRGIESLEDLVFDIYRPGLVELGAAISARRKSAMLQVYLISGAILVIAIGTLIWMAVIELRRAKKDALDSKARSILLEEQVQSRTKDLETKNRKLLETQRLLVDREKNALLGKIITGVAHEINTPLGVCITASSHLTGLMRDAGNPVFEGAGPFLKLIENNLEKISNLIRSFREVSADHLGGDIRKIDIVQYVREVLLPGMSMALEERSQQITAFFPKECLVVSHPEAISTVIAHLILNASIHGYGRTRGGVIEVRMECEEHSLTIVVKDEGCGMKEETVEHIFDPFFTTNRANGRSGLGLMAVKNLVNGGLGGEIQCRSAPGEGTEFTVHLPRNIESPLNSVYEDPR